MLILLFRPFKVGDWIEAQGVAGTVDSILIFHTVLRSGDNKRIIVPNGALSNGTVTNYSAEPLRKVIFDVGIDYDADLKNAQNILPGHGRRPAGSEGPGTGGGGLISAKARLPCP